MDKLTSLIHAVNAVQPNDTEDEEDNYAISLALKWFKDNDIQAHEDDGCIYLSVNGGFQNLEKFEIQISTAEINYRADLQARK